MTLGNHQFLPRSYCSIWWTCWNDCFVIGWSSLFLSRFPFSLPVQQWEMKSLSEKRCLPEIYEVWWVPNNSQQRATNLKGQWERTDRFVTHKYQSTLESSMAHVDVRYWFQLTPHITWYARPNRKAISSLDWLHWQALHRSEEICCLSNRSNATTQLP